MEKYFKSSSEGITLSDEMEKAMAKKWYFQDIERFMSEWYNILSRGKGINNELAKIVGSDYDLGYANGQDYLLAKMQIAFATITTRLHREAQYIDHLENESKIMQTMIIRLSGDPEFKDSDTWIQCTKQVAQNEKQETERSV